MRLAPIAALLCLILGFGALPASADAVDSAVAAARGSGLAIQSDAEATANASASRQAANLAIGHASISHLTSVCSRAAEIGLVNQALPAGEAVLQAARKAALRIAEQPPGSVRLTKQLIRAGISRTADEVMETEGQHFAQLLGGAEAREALTAFMEKRKPVFA